MTMVWTYMAYLTVSVGLTIWVARTLRKNGRIFLADRLTDNELLADSITHLLVVGFYLINVGFITLALKYGDAAVDAQTAIELLSTKVGYVLVVLGVMHFLLLAVFTAMRKNSGETSEPPSQAIGRSKSPKRDAVGPLAPARKERWT